MKKIKSKRNYFSISITTKYFHVIIDANSSGNMLKYEVEVSHSRLFQKSCWQLFVGEFGQSSVIWGHTMHGLTTRRRMLFLLPIGITCKAAMMT